MNGGIGIIWTGRYLINASGGIRPFGTESMESGINQSINYEGN